MELSLFVLIGISLGLAMDAFAVAIACSLVIERLSFRHVFRLAFHFGLFQALMPIIGWLAGQGARSYIENWDHWVAFGLLVFVGTKAIYEAFASKEETQTSDPTRGLSLIIYSIATSIDALAVGLSLAMLRVDIFYPAFIIGIITATVTALGMLIGTRLGSRFGKQMEVLGGLVLIAIGIKILLSHIW